MSQQLILGSSSDRGTCICKSAFLSLFYRQSPCDISTPLSKNLTKYRDFKLPLNMPTGLISETKLLINWEIVIESLRHTIFEVCLYVTEPECARHSRLQVPVLVHLLKSKPLYRNILGPRIASSI